MSHLSYINENLIDHLYDSYEINDHKKIKTKSTYEVGLTTGIKISLLNEELNETFSTYKKLDALFKFLLENKLIDNDRPVETPYLEETNDFVLEKTRATKLLIPTLKLKEIHGLNNLIVWISDPSPEALTDATIEPFKFTGTFLILIQAIYDRGSFAMTLSGCSALQMLVNMVNGEKPNKLGSTEKYSRANHKHPIEKLEDIDAIPIGEEEIICLYKKRYMTDEQCFSFQEKEYRGCDLLAYPLFIVSLGRSGK